MSSENIERDFPDLVRGGYRITSEATLDYNCIAWAVEQNDLVLWPDSMNQFTWPDNLPREESVDVFLEFFQRLGYEVCSDERFEPDFEKIALYIDQHGRGSHAAKLLKNGKWTSKLGPNEDIEHDTLTGLAGTRFGSVSRILRRPITPP